MTTRVSWAARGSVTVWQREAGRALRTLVWGRPFTEEALGMGQSDACVQLFPSVTLDASPPPSLQTG